ncbi:MAG: putative primase/helicase [Gammaproteobacteria bacterium]|nr:putative primase/helicase [Gammaproteobacteria bacterium]
MSVTKLSDADARSRGRRTIDVEAGELSDLVAQAQAALIATKSGIFQRGGQLVRIATLERDAAQHGVRRTAGSVVIMPVTRDYLPLALARAADWRRYDKREKGFRRVDPPTNVASAMIASVGEWRFPTLAGIVTSPTLRADGTLLDHPGYDPASRLFASFDVTDFPIINPKPSRDDALTALDLLDDLFNECVFAGGARSPHASVAIAAAVTACVRQALPMAPAFALSAHKAGSGKTTTAKAFAQLAMGRDPPVIAPSADEAELKKAVLAILIAGDAVVLIDNVAKPVDSAALCAVLTSASYSDRVLGVSQKVTVPTNATWLLTGNSIEFVGDLTTRVLLSVLDPEVEHPEERPFRRNLAEYIIEHRGDLVSAALTIPLAYLAAGSPPVKARRSRFTAWDALVRNPLLWLGAADPLDTQDELRASDPVREALIAILTAWQYTFADQAATVADAIEMATAPGQSANLPLRDALAAVAGERNGAEINTRKLGRYLKTNQRHIENGIRFESAGIYRSTCRPLYRVVAVSSVSSVSSVISNGRAEIAE